MSICILKICLLRGHTSPPPIILYSLVYLNCVYSPHILECSSVLQYFAIYSLALALSSFEQ